MVAGLFAFAEHSFGGRAAKEEEKRIRAELLKRQLVLASLPSRREGEENPTAIVQLMTDNTERVTEFRQVYLGPTIAAVTVPFLALLYIAFAVDWVVGVVVMALVPLIPILIGAFMMVFRKSSANSRKERGTLAGQYLDAIRNLVTIRMLGAGPRVEAELSEAGERNRGAIMRLLAGNQVVIIVMDGLFSLLLIVVTAALAIARFDHIGLAGLLSISLLTVLLLEPLQQVAGFFYIGMGGIASQKAIGAYLEGTSNLIHKGEAVEGRFAPPEVLHAETPIPQDLSVQMVDVHFSYGRGEVLTGFSMEVPKGARVALVGPSGVGKSTALGILKGSLPPQGGLISVEGHILEDGEPRAIRELSASVDQRTWMFTGTIAQNLAMGRPDASEEQMWEALSRAHVAREVRRMPQGLHTYLGEGATFVSGGQAQRISIARALLSERKLLFLDEPTSHVDLESERKIAEALRELPRDWTVLMTTHRPSLMEAADVVYEVRSGKAHKIREVQSATA